MWWANYLGIYYQEHSAHQKKQIYFECRDMNMNSFNNEYFLNKKKMDISSEINKKSTMYDDCYNCGVLVVPKDSDEVKIVFTSSPVENLRQVIVVRERLKSKCLLT